MRIWLIDNIRRFFRSSWRFSWRSLGQRLPSYPSAEVIDREYIEGESPEEIGELSQMTESPDKAQRHLHEHTEEPPSRRAA